MQPVDAQASLRAELAGEIAGAQAVLSEQLAQLQAVANSGSDNGASRELMNQLAVLKSLSVSVATASGGALSKLCTDVSSSVAASAIAVQQGQAATAEAKASAGMSQGEYDKATAELDRRVAATMAEDNRHYDEARERAARLGIDMTEADAERARLEQQRREAIARGEKVAERQADLAIAQGTYDAMDATGASQEDLDAQQRILDVRREALAEQSRLQAGNWAERKGASRSEADNTASQTTVDNAEMAASRTEQLGGATSSEATRLHFEADVRSTVSEAARDVAPAQKVEAALTPEAREAARQAMQTVTVNVEGFSLDETGPLAHAETAATTVRGKPAQPSQGLA